MAEPSTAIILTNVFPILLRYVVLAILYMILFIQFKKPTIQFILFIIALILIILTCIFLFKDISSTPLLTKSIYDLYLSTDPAESRNVLTKFFVIIMILTVLLFIASFSIVLAVFDYGKKTTNDYNSYTMTPNNTLLLNQFKASFRTYIIYLAFFAFFIIYSHTEGAAKKFMYNTACIILSIIVVISSSYCCVAAVKFLDNKKHRRQLYQ